MNARAVTDAILAYGRAEYAHGGNTGSYGAVDAALDALLLAVFRAPSREIALRCAWGDHYFTMTDEVLARAGAPVSHGCCPEHQHLLEGEA